MKKAKTSPSIRSKIFKSMTLIATGLMFLLTIATSVMYYNYFINSTSDSSLAQLDYITGQLDYYMDSVSNYSLTLMTDDIIQKDLIKYKNQPEHFTEMNKMQMKDRINHAIQSTPFIHSVTFYSCDKKQIATTEFFPISSDMADVIATEDGVWFLQQKNSNVNKHVTLYTLSMVQPVYSIATGAPLGFIEISIPESTISDIYSDNTDSNRHIYITDENGIIKSTDGSLPIGTQYKNFITKTRAISKHNITFTRSLQRLNWYITNSISFSTFFLPLVQVLLLSVLAVVFCIGICFIISRKLSGTITSPLYRLIDHTQKIKEGNWSTIDAPCNDRDIALLFSEFNAMIQAQEQLKDNLIETTKMKNQISLDLIQQQVNPHFLYNTLDNICSLAELDEKTALIDIVMSLSTFYRVGLSSGKFRVTIGDELEITTAYLHIMQIRYFHKFDYTIQCPEELKKYSCIKLLLQPIVENSIYHGIKEMESKGLLEIIIEDLKENIRITVQDNGVGFTQEAYQKIWECSDHFGVKNIHQRIQLYYGEDYGLAMSNRTTGGCITTMMIPKKEETNNANNFINRG